MPGEIEIARGVLRECGHPEPRQDAIEVLPMQHIELAEGPAAGTYVLQGGLVLGAPGVSEGAPVELVSGGSENGLSLARDAGAKTYQRAEHGEEQRTESPRPHGSPAQVTR